MILRFSLYGFLKNQRYFEAFLVLAFLDKGLDFFQIGLLVACRSFAVAFMEIPSGAIADVFGRRRSMIVSLTGYIASFAILGFANHLAVLAAGMALYGVGDSFRSGTHKAMIFSWLGARGRTGERVAVYGYTRSWSMFGSAVSVIVGAGIVLATGGYRWVFFGAIVPYLFGLVNMMGYPRELDETPDAVRSLAGVTRHLAETLRATVRRPGLRRLVMESMGFGGVFAAVKDYLQPVLEAASIVAVGVLVAGPELNDARRSALLIGPIYVVLHLLSGLASRRAHRLTAAAGGEAHAIRFLWAANVAVFVVLAAGGWFDLATVLILGFVALHVLQNLWRPILISRFDDEGDERQGASLLSVESQAQRAATMVLAPLVGLAVDAVRSHEVGGAFWPVGAVGVIIGLMLLVTTRTGTVSSAP